MPYSYHSHSGQFCHHGHGQLERVVQEAIRKGFKKYGLSEHMPRLEFSHMYPEEIQANCTPDTLATTFEDFFKEARRLQWVYKDQIELLVAAETEFISTDYADQLRLLRNCFNIDYVVGSLHHVQAISIDFSPELYEIALEKAGDGSLVKLFKNYFDEQFDMLSETRPEVVGHFDLIRIFAVTEQADIALHDPEVWERIVRNIKYVVDYGGLFEINSRAWKKGLLEPYPQQDIVKTIQQQGGRFVLSDDCHGPHDVGMDYDKLQTYLKQCNIHTIYYLTLRDRAIVIEKHEDIHEDPFWENMKDWE
ncbi:Polymerase/histidinol phosphatase-like protein [Spinellus fusiger]|nr:Polymerase/histidinol phosphatase-like protein [Spinellus fusiger]